MYSQKTTSGDVKTEIKFSMDVNPIPFIPRQVDLSHLKSNGKLLDENQIKDFTFDHHEKKNARYSKSDLCYEYSICQIENRYFAIYKGETQEKLFDQKFMLGKGGFGKVKLLQDLITKKWYAYKIQPEDSDFSIGESEYENLKILDEGIGHIIRKSPSHHVIQHEIVMELAPGVELFEILAGSKEEKKQPQKLPQSKWLELAIGLLEAVQFIHSKNLVHCDIKLENFVCDLVSGKNALVDLAFACSQYLNKCDTAKGTPGYLAPEVINHNEFSVKSDIFALGKSLGLLLNLVEIAEDGDFKLISETDKKFHLNKKIPNEAIRLKVLAFLHEMIAYNKEHRPTLTECLNKFKGFHAQSIANENRSTGLLDIDEFIKSDYAKQEALLAALQAFDEVWLIDSKKQYQELDLIKIRRKCEEKNINLGNKIFSHSSGSLIPLLNDLPSFNDDQETGIKRTYCFVTCIQLTNHIVKLLQENRIYSLMARPYDHFHNYKAEIESCQLTQDAIITRNNALIEILLNVLQSIENENTTDSFLTKKNNKRREILTEAIKFFKKYSFETNEETFDKWIKVIKEILPEPNMMAFFTQPKPSERRAHSDLSFDHKIDSDAGSMKLT